MNTKNKVICLSFILFTLLITSSIQSQEFIKSRGLMLFNRGDYDSSIVVIKNWLLTKAKEPELAKYYLGESYYNLAMRETQVRLVRDYFRKANQYFQEVLGVSDVKKNYPKVYFGSQLKSGWCFFRRAETGERPADLLNVAFNSFIRIDSNAPDSLILQANFLAGESRFREAILRRFDAFWPEISTDKINKTIDNLREANTYYKKVLQLDSDDLMKLVTEIRITDVKYELLKVYQSVPEPMFSQIVDDGKGNSSRETALNLASAINYPSILSKFKSSQRNAFLEFLFYTQGMVNLNQFLMTFNPQNRLDAIDNYNQVSSNEFGLELKFRQGNLDHTTTQPGDNDNFFSLSQNDRQSFYFQALPSSSLSDYSESYFWLGAVQFIANRNTGINNFQSFILRSIERTEPRISALLDQAQYWRSILYLDANRGNKASLRELKLSLENFDPKNSEISQQKDLLLNLTQLELGEDIRSEILRSRGVEKAVEMIQFLLPKAASVTGINRLNYLKQLQRIFAITQSEMTNETNFFEGIANSLEAEIQGDEDDKKNLFSKSADILTKVRGTYVDEANYIRGRSLFFAEKYDAAKNVLKGVINEKRSLRSLFYFAEILRAKGFGDAAKLCFDVIKDKTRTNQDGRFWFENAEAAIRLCVNRADGSSELSGLNYRNVEFPDNLLSGQENSYEQLADPKFLRFQRLQQSLDLLKKFSLPKKSLYAFAQAPNTSIFKKGSLTSLPSVLNEILRKETSFLELFVLSGEGTDSPIRATLNDVELLRIGENKFKSDVLELGETVELIVRQQGSYMYKKVFDVVKPGKQIISIPMTKKVKFQLMAQPGKPTNYAEFEHRLDKNIVIRNEIKKIPVNSELMLDFSRKINFRDVAFSAIHNRFYVVESSLKNGIKMYDESGGRFVSDEVFRFDFSNYDMTSLQEPEGICLDNQGNFYLTDFGANRVVSFDSTGKYRYHFGKFGDNENREEGDKIRLMYPTRINIEEDATGVSFTNEIGETEIVSRNPYLFIADRNGIYRCDLDGQYLETILRPNNSDIFSGSIYALGVENYGSAARLFIGLRESFQVKSFSAIPQD